MPQLQRADPPQGLGAQLPRRRLQRELQPRPDHPQGRLRHLLAHREALQAEQQRDLVPGDRLVPQLHRASRAQPQQQQPDVTTSQPVRGRQRRQPGSVPEPDPGHHGRVQLPERVHAEHFVQQDREDPRRRVRGHDGEEELHSRVLHAGTLPVLVLERYKGNQPRLVQSARRFRQHLPHEQLHLDDQERHVRRPEAALAAPHQQQDHHSGRAGFCRPLDHEGARLVQQLHRPLAARSVLDAPLVGNVKNGQQPHHSDRPHGFLRDAGPESAEHVQELSGNVDGLRASAAGQPDGAGHQLQPHQDAGSGQDHGAQRQAEEGVPQPQLLAVHGVDFHVQIDRQEVRFHGRDRQRLQRAQLARDPVLPDPDRGHVHDEFPGVPGRHLAGHGAGRSVRREAAAEPRRRRSHVFLRGQHLLHGAPLHAPVRVFVRERGAEDGLPVLGEAQHGLQQLHDLVQPRVRRSGRMNCCYFFLSDKTCLRLVFNF